MKKRRRIWRNLVLFIIAALAAVACEMRQVKFLPRGAKESGAPPVPVALSSSSSKLRASVVATEQPSIYFVKLEWDSLGSEGTALYRRTLEKTAQDAELVDKFTAGQREYIDRRVYKSRTYQYW